MANRKISDLTALTAPATGDLLPIVDISEAAAADKNKKITFGELFASIPAGTAAAPSVAFEGDSKNGIYSPGADQLTISTNGTGRLFVNADGTISVGSTSVLASPTVYSSANPTIGFSDGTNAAYTGLIGTQNRLLNLSSVGTTLIQSDRDIETNVVGGYPWIVKTANTERMRLDSSGRLGLGTSSPGSLLNLSTSSTGTSTESLRIEGGQRSGASFATGVRVYTESTVSDSNRHLRIICNGNTGFSIQPYETSTNNAATDSNLLLCPSGGRVGIGTAGPQGKLESATGDSTDYAIVANNSYSSGDQNYISLRAGSTQIGSINRVTNDIAIKSFYDGVTFFTGTAGTATQKAKIDSSGRLLVGTSSAFGNSNLQVRGGGTNQISLQDSGTTSFYHYLGSWNNGTGNFAIIHSTSGIGVQLNGSSATSWSSFSDVRLKNITGSIPDALNKVDKLEPIYFSWKSDSNSTPCVGLSGQSVREVLPEATDLSKQFNQDEDEQEYVSVRYTDVIPLLVAALQESKKRIEALEADVAALKGA